MSLFPIRTEADYQRAMTRIDELWGRVEPGTPDGDELDILCTLVEAFEKQQYPIAPPQPEEVLRFRLEQLGLSATAVRAAMDVVAEQYVPRQAA